MGIAPEIIISPEKMRAVSVKCFKEGRPIGFVPTMGFLHEGHLSLVRLARKENHKLVVSIFVNPLQFGVNEDFGTYPRNLERDIELLTREGVDTIFCPRRSDIYQKNFSTSISAGPYGKMYCGKSRPHFFEGVLTVVNLLLQLVQPTKAYFGEKDFQQLFLVRKMCRELMLPVQIVAGETVRESSGLAMSSRNAYLTAGQKEVATCLSKAIETVQSKVSEGHCDVVGLTSLVSGIILQSAGVKSDYISFVDEKTLSPLGDRVFRKSRLLLAAYVGENPAVRLIDNGPIVV